MEIQSTFEAIEVISRAESMLTILFGGLAGAILGAVLGGMHSSKLAKTQLTISVISDYLEKYHDLHAECIGMIEHPNDTYSAAKINSVIRMGNWGESVAILYHKKLIEKDVIDEYGLPKVLKLLYKDVVNSPLNTHAKYESLKYLKKL